MKCPHLPVVYEIWALEHWAIYVDFSVLLLLLLLLFPVVVLQLSLCLCNYTWISTITTTLHRNNNHQKTNYHKNIKQFMYMYLCCCCFCIIFLLFFCNCGWIMAHKQHETVTTITTEKNQHKLLIVGELGFEIDVRWDGPLCCCCCCYCFMLLSLNCHCACATTDESQQQQQQYYTVTTIIKQLMNTKILNNLCRFICILLLLLFLCNWSFVEKTCVMQWADIFKWSTHWAKMSKPPSNRPQNYATPLHWMGFAYSRMHIYLGQMSPCQLTIDLCNTTTPKHI